MGDVSSINRADKKKLYDQLLEVAKRKTAQADVKLDKHGKPIEEPEEDLGDNVIIVDPATMAQQLRNGNGGSEAEKKPS